MGKPMTPAQRARRNRNPHKPAIAAMWLWGARYAAQGGGSMDFWDGLTKSEKRICRDMVKKIEAAPAESPSDQGGER